MKRVFALVVLAAILSLGISVYSESGGMILKLADCAQITIPNGLTSINSANWQNNEIGFMKDSDEGLVLLIIHREAVIIPIQEWTNILKEEGYLEVSSSRLASGFDYEAYIYSNHKVRI